MWSWSKLHTERISQVFVECVLFYFSWLKTNPSADAKQRKNLEWPYFSDYTMFTPPPNDGEWSPFTSYISSLPVGVLELLVKAHQWRHTTMLLVSYRPIIPQYHNILALMQVTYFTHPINSVQFRSCLNK